MGAGVFAGRQIAPKCSNGAANSMMGRDTVHGVVGEEQRQKRA